MPTRRAPLGEVGNFGVPPAGDVGGGYRAGLGRKGQARPAEPLPLVPVVPQQQPAPAQQPQQPIAMNPNNLNQPNPFEGGMEGLIEKIDNQFIDNPQSACPYRRDIWDCLREAETKFRFCPNYMEHRPEISAKMRAVLFDWIADVHNTLKLQVPTLYLTLHLIDAYLDREQVTREYLQLVGMVGLLVAAKYEEIYPPRIDKLVFLSAKTYNRDEVIDVEKQFLNLLDYNLTVATVYPFLCRALEVSHADTRTVSVSNYISELGLMEYKLLRYLPSVIGASCVYVARKALGYEGESWTEANAVYFGYKEEDLNDCALDLVHILGAATGARIQSVRKKYSTQRFGEVSRLFNERVCEELRSKWRTQ